MRLRHEDINVHACVYPSLYAWKTSNWTLVDGGAGARVAARLGRREG